MRVLGIVLIASAVGITLMIRPGMPWHRAVDGHLGVALIPPLILAGIAAGVALLIAG